MKAMANLVVAALCSGVACAQDAGPWVKVGSDGLLKYRSDANGNRIPDFSMVGYRTGVVPLPGTEGGVAVPTRAILMPGKGDQTTRIQAAIDKIAHMPLDDDGFRGALLLKKGEFPVSGQLRIHASGIVLRGEGAAEATGTVIRDTGKDREPLISVLGNGEVVSGRWSSKTLNPDSLASSVRKVVDDYVPVGATRLTLDSAAGFGAGDTVVVERACTEDWLKSVGAMRPGVDWHTKFAVVRWDRVIVAVDGDSVVLDAPVTTALEARFGGATVVRYTWPERIENVGVEDLLGISSHASPTDEEHSWTFIAVDRAQNVYVNRVAARHFAYAAVHIGTRAKWVTVQDSKCLDPVSRVEGGRRYSFCLDGQLSLVRGCYARQGRHDFVANDYMVAGPNVFLDCNADECVSESGPHRHWTSGMLFDNVSVSDRISLYHRKNYGRNKGAKPPYHLGHGWASANCVAWNCTVRKTLLVESPPGATNWAIGCKAGAFADRGPERGARKGGAQFEANNQPHPIRSLYEAQLAERLNREKR